MGVCCPQGSAEQQEALAAELRSDGICDDQDRALKVAGWVLQHFDLAPAGSLKQFKHDIATMARSKDKG